MTFRNLPIEATPEMMEAGMEVAPMTTLNGTGWRLSLSTEHCREIWAAMVKVAPSPDRAMLAPQQRVLPVELTEEMYAAFFEARDCHPAHIHERRKEGKGWEPLPSFIWKAMLAAAPVVNKSLTTDAPVPSENKTAPSDISANRFRFIAQMAAHLAQARRIRPFEALPVALNTYIEFVGEQKIEFGDPRFDWTSDGAKTLIDEMVLHYAGAHVPSQRCPDCNTTDTALIWNSGDGWKCRCEAGHEFTPDDPPPPPTKKKGPVSDHPMPLVGWQPIATAPRDGTMIFLWFIGGLPRAVVGCAVKPINEYDLWTWGSSPDQRGEYNQDYITHWMPIPVPSQIMPESPAGDGTPEVGK